MSKKAFLPLLGLSLAFAAFGGSAAHPPKYLGIADFQQCLGTRVIDSYSAWCMPAARLENCPASSWALLQALSGAERVPDCPAGSSDAGASPKGK